MPTITMTDKPVSNLGTTAESQAQTSAKQKAIQAFMGGAPQVDQTSISPEEMSTATGHKQEQSSEPQEEQKVTNEPPVSEKSEKEEPQLSAQYAVLARKEKALRAKELAFQQAQKVREAEWAQREEQLKSQVQSIDHTKYIAIDDLKRNAYQKLVDLGLTYDDISAQALQAQSPEFQNMRQIKDEIRQELQQLRQEQEQIRKASENQQAEAYQQALRQIEAEARQLVYTDPAYDTIKNTKSVKQVVKLIERTFKETGELLSVDKAADLVESELIEQGSRYAQLKKIQERLNATSKHNQEKQQAQSPKQQQSSGKEPQLKTLTNAVGNSKPLSARERALRAFKGEI